MNLPPEQLAARYNLLCRATQAQPPADDPRPVAEVVDKLQALIDHNLLQLARHGSPDHFAELYLEFGRELERFREFCAFPALAQKVVVGFGGAFSAGKSSLINALLGEKLLAAQLDPTTSLPTYLLSGDEDAIFALNLRRHRIRLSLNEFKSLTHDELSNYGSAVGGLLHAAFITRAGFPWPNLALIDTPGYSKPDQASHSARTDENLARAQLNAAQAIVWVVSASKGCITEDDLKFLAALNPGIPKLVVVSHADSRPADDIRAIVDGIRRTLAERGLPVLDVLPATKTNRTEYPLQPILARLSDWSQQTRQLRFAHNFKALFTRYSRSIEAELRQSRWQLDRLNRILVLMDDDSALADAGELKTRIDEQIQRLKTQNNELKQLSMQFFTKLKEIGDKVGIPLPEPDEIELLADNGGGNLLDVLIAGRKARNGKEPDYRLQLRALAQAGDCTRSHALLRRHIAANPSSLADLQKLEASAVLTQLLRQPSQKLVDALAKLNR